MMLFDMASVMLVDIVSMMLFDMASVTLVDMVSLESTQKVFPVVDQVGIDMRDKLGASSNK